MEDKEKFIIVNELLETSSSDDDDEIIEKVVINIIKEERPKIKNYVNIVKEYSDQEVRHI